MIYSRYVRSIIEGMTVVSDRAICRNGCEGIKGTSYGHYLYIYIYICVCISFLYYSNLHFLFHYPYITPIYPPNPPYSVQWLAPSLPARKKERSRVDVIPGPGWLSKLWSLFGSLV